MWGKLAYHVSVFFINDFGIEVIIWVEKVSSILHNKHQTEFQIGQRSKYKK